MISHASTPPIFQSDDSVFFTPPERLVVNETGKTSYSTSAAIDTLIQELRQKGPIVALGYLGPNCYKQPPFRLKNNLANTEIFGWEPGTRHEKVDQTRAYAIVIGARKIDNQELVYFVMSTDCTADKNFYKRVHRPSVEGSTVTNPTTVKPRVYVTSHKTFHDYLIDLYPKAL